MINSVLKYELEELPDFKVRDYFSKDLQEFRDRIEEIMKYTESFIMEDNDTFEKISYRLYRSTAYWDVLALLNDRDPLEFTFDSDVIAAIATNTFLKFRSEISPEIVINEVDYIRNRIDKLTKEKEEKRTILVIKPDYLAEAVGILKKYKIM